MQSTFLNTTSSLLSVTGTKIAKTDTSFLNICASVNIVAFFIMVKIYDFTDVTFFFIFLKTLMALLPVVRIWFFYFLVLFYFCSLVFLFFSFLPYFKSSVASVQDKTGFESLALDFLVQKKSLKLWVYTLEQVLWNKRRFLGQWASKFWTMALDFRPALAFALIIFCIISLKQVNT